MVLNTRQVRAAKRIMMAPKCESDKIHKEYCGSDLCIVDCITVLIVASMNYVYYKQVARQPTLLTPLSA